MANDTDTSPPNISLQSKKVDDIKHGPLNEKDNRNDGALTEESDVLEQVSAAKKSKFAPRLSGLFKKPPKLALLGAAILISGGVIVYENFVQHSPKSLSPAGMQLVPQTTLATVTLTTDELAWTKLRQFGTADSQEQFDGLLRDWKDRLFTLNGYSFKRDIKPWIGDRVTLALLPASNTENPENNGLSAAAQNMVLVVPIADPLKARALLSERASSTNESTERSYKGSKIQTLTTPDQQTIATTVIGKDWLLLSNTEEGLEQAIDTYKGRRSLLNSAGYRKAASRVESRQPPGKNFAQIYLNIPVATQALAPPAGTPNASTGSLIPLQGSEGMVATMLIEAEGVRFEGTSWLSPQNDLAYGELRNEAGEMPRRLPDDTLVAMSGSNLKTFWQGLSEGNTAPPFFPDPQNLKAGLLTQTGLDIDEDIMPWAAGEFALGILPPVEDAAEDAAEDGAEAPANEDELTPEAPVIESAPLLLMVKTSDRQMAESVWSQIDDVMVDRYRYEVETSEFEGGSITNWISPFQAVQFSHGWLPGNVAFFAVGGGVDEAIAPIPNNPLASDRLFQTLTADAPQPNNGHFYIDLAQINALDGVFPVPQLPTEGPTRAIEAIGLTSTVSDRTMEYDLYVKLAKAEKPGAL